MADDQFGAPAEARSALPGQVSTGGLRRIGGEMYSWSDHDPTRGPDVTRSGALRYLLTELGGPGRTVLVAGPHDDKTIAGLLDGGAIVTCLVRSLTDAERLHRQFPSATVLCGSVAKLETAARFDLVIAADGVDRLGSTEGEQTAVPDVLRTLTSVVDEGGTLVLMNDNLLGVHHIVELNPGRHYESDAGWHPVSEYEDLRPASLAQIEEQLTGDGLSVAGVYAVYPSPQTPTVLIGQELLGDISSPLRGHLVALLSQAFTEAYRNVPVLSDPRRLVARALRAGAEGAIAPGWLTIVRRGGSSPVRGHALIVSETNDAYAYELSLVDGRPRIDVLVAPGDRQERSGMRRVTDPSAYATLAGRIFEERLLQLCARADVTGLRAELNRFVAWLEGQARDGAVSGPAALSAPYNVLDDGYELHLTPPRWEPVEPVPVTTVVVRALWSFSVRLITGNHPHPWQLTSSAVDLTSTLLGAVGRELSEDELRAAVDLQVAYDAADEGLTLSQQQARRIELLSIQPGSATVDIQGYRELEEAEWRQRYQVSHLLALQEWTENIIKSRDLALSRMDWEIQLFRSSFTGKVLMISRAVYRTLARDTRKVMRRVKGLVTGRRGVEAPLPPPE